MSGRSRFRNRPTADEIDVIFVENDKAFEDLKSLALQAGDEKDSIKFGDGVLYWKVKIGNTLDSPFAKIMAKAKYKSSITTRNLNTLEKMV